METPTYVPDTALLQSQQRSSDLPPSPGSSQIIAEASPEGGGALRYLCPICRASYAQRQGVRRHIRTAHNPKPKQCFLCEFSWARPYEYRNHLKKKHRGVDPDLILGKPPRSRRRAIPLTEHLPQQPPVSPPAVKHQQDCAESQPNPQPVYADQIVTMDEQFLDATYHFAMLPSTEGRTEPINDLNISLQEHPGEFGLPSAHLSGSTVTHSPSNPEMAPIPTLSPPVVGSFGPMHYSPLSYADIDATLNSILNSTF